MNHGKQNQEISNIDSRLRPGWEFQGKAVAAGLGRPDPRARSRKGLLGHTLIVQGKSEGGCKLIEAETIAMSIEIGKTPFGPARLLGRGKRAGAELIPSGSRSARRAATGSMQSSLVGAAGVLAKADGGKSSKSIVDPLAAKVAKKHAEVRRDANRENLSIGECLNRRSAQRIEAPGHSVKELTQLLTELSDLRVWILRRSAHSRYRAGQKVCTMLPEDRLSIDNLRHYLSFRSRDLRPLQERLSALGCSSLGRSEVHVIDSIERVLNLLHRMLRPGAPSVGFSGVAVDQVRGYQRLAENNVRLLGPEPPERAVRIMVTMPTEAADDFGLVRQLALSGMDVGRINCAHDDPAAWLRMIDNLRRAADETGRSIKIAADLAGHKIRTGELERQEGVLHLSPKRDRLGRVLAPARLRLLNREAPAALEEDESLHDFLWHQVTLAWENGPEELQPGDALRFTDARGARRVLKVESVDSAGAWATLDQASYLVNDLGWKLRRSIEVEPLESEEGLSLPEMVSDYLLAQEREFRGVFAGIAPEPVNIRLRRGDHLLLTREPLPGREALRDHNGAPVCPARISCTMPKVFEVLREGQMVWIDDGKFGARVAELCEEGALLEITACRPGGSRLRPDKGLNFPGLELDLPGLAAHDLSALKVLAGKVDIINFSFVETESHIMELISVLRQFGAPDTGVIAKIETARAFNNAAEIALAAMGRVPFGIMIARGDLAVEVGPERLAEVQEELLWLAEAGHFPVVWATQVMETLVKKGVISRPELTDAAMGERAECVMLNKGPFIEKALMSLHNIFSRMQEHQRKKSARLRALNWGRKPYESSAK